MRALALILLLTGMVACAHHRDVRPGAEGIHKVVVNTEEGEQGPRNAIDQANHFCEERYEKVAAITNEGTEYTSDMDKSDYKRAKLAGKVLQGAGTLAIILGGRNESNLGWISTGTGAVVSGVAGNGYTTEMSFKCI